MHFINNFATNLQTQLDRKTAGKKIKLPIESNSIKKPARSPPACLVLRRVKYILLVFNNKGENKNSLPVVTQVLNKTTRLIIIFYI